MNRRRIVVFSVIAVISLGLILSACGSSEKPTVVAVTRVPTESTTAKPEILSAAEHLEVVGRLRTRDGARQHVLGPSAPDWPTRAIRRPAANSNKTT